jgi:ubiquinone/menaquinone biosynthesis C-methylase UbiE
MDSQRSQSFTQASVPDNYERFMLRQLFEPWARDLVERAALRPGAAVLDVASGLGPVARLAARAAGPDGRVVASDISAAMLARAAGRLADPESAPIEYLECSALDIKAADGRFDAVLCQQGLQFFPDRAAAVREMHRVTRPGGAVLIACWAAERPLGLFGTISATLQELGVPEPFPQAYDDRSFCLSAAEFRDVLDGAGFREIEVTTAWLDAVWPTPADAASAVLGTPFGPGVAALPVAEQEQVRTTLAARLGQSADGTVTVPTTSNIARGLR